MSLFKTKEEAVSYAKAHLKIQYATNSDCYKAGKQINVSGSVNHSVGCAQPASAVIYNAMNKAGAGWGVTAILGDFHSGEGTILLCMPMNYRPWGCASGSKGSWNNSRIQWEVCEPTGHTYAGGTMVNYNATKNAEYFERMWKLLVAWNVYCVEYFGYKYTAIADHAESYKAGYGSNHSDMGQWLPKHGKSMDMLRAEVNEVLNSTDSAAAKAEEKTSTAKSVSISKGDVVKISSGAKYYGGSKIPAWVIAKNWIVKDVSGDRVVIDKSQDGAYSICSPVAATYLTVVAICTTTKVEFKSYIVRVNASALNIRKGPGTNYATTGTIRDKGAYTIIAESEGRGAKLWGKLKSGAGWISLDYTKKV